MSIRKISVVVVFALAIAWLGTSFFEDSNGSGQALKAPDQARSGWHDSPFQTSAEHYLSGYIVDKNRQISLKDTGLSESPVVQEQLNDYIATSLVNRGTADHFRFLQTQFHTGMTLRENTEAIHQHLLSTLPKDEAEKLFELYQKFLDFELTVGDKTKGWKMPEGPGEALALIANMQQLQQRHFGEEHADLLFGGELKSLEYTARRSGILNDQVALGIEKEALLKKLAIDMFGAEGAKLDDKKNPYNLFEEKLLVYKYDLEKLEPLERNSLIKALRDKYLPPSANQS